MKKLLCVFSVMIMICTILTQFYSVSAEKTSHIQSDLSIFFEKGSEEPSKPVKPITPEEPGKVKPNPLPQTGELLASLIFLLMGVAILILVIGIFTIKIIVELDYKEGILQ